MPTASLALAYIVAVWPALTGAIPGDTAVVERERVLMGTTLRVRVEADDRQRALRAASAAFAEVERLEGVLSTWDPTSAVAAVNGAPDGSPVQVDADLFRLLESAERLVGVTGGAFEPRIGPLVEAWDLRGEGRVPTGAELARAMEASGPATFELDPAAGTVTRRHPGAWIDTGGFGKGAALAAAAAALRESGISTAVLDFGGQTYFLAPPEAHTLLAVAHPERRWEAACVLSIESGHSAATSGSSEQINHILDPRSGRPAPPWGSVTVISPDPVEADAFSTALYVMGAAEGAAWAAAFDGIAVLLLEARPEGLVPHWNAAMERLLSDAGAGCLSDPVVDPLFVHPSSNQPEVFR